MLKPATTKHILPSSPNGRFRAVIAICTNAALHGCGRDRRPVAMAMPCTVQALGAGEATATPACKPRKFNWFGRFSYRQRGHQLHPSPAIPQIRPLEPRGAAMIVCRTLHSQNDLDRASVARFRDQMPRNFINREKSLRVRGLAV